jgi:hypothetical protein
MSVTDLLERLREAEVAVKAEGDDLVLTAPLGVPDDLVAEVRGQKQELLADACAECGRVDLAVYDGAGRPLCTEHGFMRCSICGQRTAPAGVTACVPCVAGALISGVGNDS